MRPNGHGVVPVNPPLAFNEVKMTPTQIAETCHEANRVLTKFVGDVPVQAPWGDIDEHTKNSCIAGVEWRLSNREAPASASHDEWLKFKLADGWTLGPEKNMEKKTHPALLPYDQLPKGTQAKDALFTAIVLALAEVTP